MSRVCFYHFPCADGVTAAWAIIKAFPGIICRGIKPQDDQITEEKYIGKEAIFVDVTPSKRILEDMLEKCTNIVILDHHVSNEKIIKPFFDHPKLTAIFDMERSGCQMAWDHYNTDGQERPWFIDYVADRDLWKFKLKDSKIINMGLMDLDYLNIDGLHELYSITKNEKDKNDFINNKLIPTAKVLEMKNEKTIKICISGACRRVMKVNDKEYNVWVANGYGYLSSETGNRLMYKKFANGQSPDFAVIFSYKFNDNIWKVSLRSLDVDVSEVAAAFGGGGHKQAAGFNYKKNFQDLFSKYIDR